MKKTATQSGFTLIEMLVAIAVALVFVGGMLFSRGDFDSTVRLGSIAREVALIAREAQTYGGSGGSSDVSAGKPHGIYLDASADSIIKLYVDEGGSGYDSTTDNLLEEFRLPDRYTMNTFCVSNDVKKENCSGSVDEPTDLSIYFERPSLSANFHTSDASVTASSSQKAIIELTHDDSGNMRSVIIDTTGYITVP